MSPRQRGTRPRRARCRPIRSRPTTDRFLPVPPIGGEPCAWLRGRGRLLAGVAALALLGVVLAIVLGGGSGGGGNPGFERFTGADAFKSVEVPAGWSPRQDDVDRQVSWGLGPGVETILTGPDKGTAEIMREDRSQLPGEHASKVLNTLKDAGATRIKSPERQPVGGRPTSVAHRIHPEQRGGYRASDRCHLLLQQGRLWMANPRGRGQHRRRQRRADGRGDRQDDGHDPGSRLIGPEAIKHGSAARSRRAGGATTAPEAEASPCRAPGPRRSRGPREDARGASRRRGTSPRSDRRGRRGSRETSRSRSGARRSQAA